MNREPVSATQPVAARPTTVAAATAENDQQTVAEDSNNNTSLVDRERTAETETNGAQPSTQHSPNVREIHKNSWLKKMPCIDKWSGKFPKAQKLEKFWVVFCVHDDNEAFLEFYENRRSAYSHFPLNSVSLSKCLHISPTIVAQGNDHEFVITLDTQVIRLAASTNEQMLEWMDTLSTKLREMGVLEPKDNLYSKEPITSRPSTGLSSMESQSREDFSRLSLRDPNSPLPPVPSTAAAQPPDPTDAITNPTVVYIRNPSLLRVSTPSSSNRGSPSTAVEPTTTAPESIFSFEVSSDQNSRPISTSSHESSSPLLSPSEPGPSVQSLEQGLSSSVQGSNLPSSKQGPSLTHCPNVPSPQPGPSTSQGPSLPSSTQGPNLLSSKQGPNVPSSIQGSKLPTSIQGPNQLSLNQGSVSVQGPHVSSQGPNQQSLEQGSNVQSGPESSTLYEPLFYSASSNVGLGVRNPNYENPPHPSRHIVFKPTPALPPRPSAEFRRASSSIPGETQNVARTSNLGSLVSASEPSLNAPLQSSFALAEPSSSAAGALLRTHSQVEASERPSHMPLGERHPHNGLRRQSTSSFKSGTIPVDENGKPISLREAQVQKLQSEISHKSGVRLVLRKKDCLNAIAFVECFNCVWVAGWKQKEHPLLHNTFHVGDRILSIAGHRIPNVQEAQKAIKQQPSTVEFIVRRLPYAKILAIKREYEGQDLGIVREGGTAEIKEVKASGLASRQGLLAKSTSLDGTSFCNWVLTEINHRPLNLFFKDNEVQDRLNAVGLDISLLVQPIELVKALKKQLKTIRSYKDFIVQ